MSLKQVYDLIGPSTDICTYSTVKFLSLFLGSDGVRTEALYKKKAGSFSQVWVSLGRGFRVHTVDYDPTEDG